MDSSTDTALAGFANMVPSTPVLTRPAQSLPCLITVGVRAGLTNDSGDIELPITQDELAGWIGATREATARSLATFRRAGAISTGRHRIVLHGLDVLADVMRNCGS